MAALLKPHAAFKLVSALKQEISIPIHLHTHDTTGNGVATVIMAAEAGVDIVDTAFNSMSGLTSQPALNSVVAALKNTRRDTGINLKGIQLVSDYWDAVRPVYQAFESDLKSGSAEIYKYEIPGGQYSNLKPQVESFGLGHKFHEVKENYKVVNDMVGDIVKVTPSSKMVGDFAIFMVQNNLTPENIQEKAAHLAFPDSVVSYFKGMMGQPSGGFPEELQKIVLKGEEPITCRPGELLPPEDFDKIEKYLKEELEIEPDKRDILSYALYPDVFEEYVKYRKEVGDFTRMGSDVFFHGLYEGETCEVEVAEGKAYMIRLLSVSNPDNEGNKILVFEVDGNRREVKIKDKNNKFIQDFNTIEMADPSDRKQIGAPIPGTILSILVEEGETVAKNQAVIIVEAMKMEAKVTAAVEGVVGSIIAKEGQQVKAGQLLISLK